MGDFPPYRGGPPERLASGPVENWKTSTIAIAITITIATAIAITIATITAGLATPSPPPPSPPSPSPSPSPRALSKSKEVRAGVGQGQARLLADARSPPDLPLLVRLRRAQLRDRRRLPRLGAGDPPELVREQAPDGGSRLQGAARGLQLSGVFASDMNRSTSSSVALSALVPTRMVFCHLSSPRKPCCTSIWSNCAPSFTLPSGTGVVMMTLYASRPARRARLREVRRGHRGPLP